MSRVSVLILMLLATSVAATADPASALPNWARDAWSEMAGSRALEVSTRLNPSVLSGDFDGDGQRDVAVFVQSRTTRKDGIVFIFRARRSPDVIGAGKDFGNGGDDFSWLDYWTVRKARSSDGNTATDELVIAKQESASAVIAMINGSLRWQQEGD